MLGEKHVWSVPVLSADPKHWLERAEEARAVADGMRDPEARRAMLEIAERYERIAKRAEARGAGVAMPPTTDH